MPPTFSLSSSLPGGSGPAGACSARVAAVASASVRAASRAALLVAVSTDCRSLSSRGQQQPFQGCTIALKGNSPQPSNIHCKPLIISSCSPPWACNTKAYLPRRTAWGAPGHPT
jgi:hypothetical protein